MRHYGDNGNNLDRYVGLVWRDYGFGTLFPAWEPEYGKMMDLLGLDMEGMIGLFRKHGVREDDLVEEDFVIAGRKPFQRHVLLGERVAKTKDRWKREKGRQVLMEGDPVDLYAVPHSYASVTSRRIFQKEIEERLRVMEVPELVRDKEERLEKRLDRDTIGFLRDFGMLSDNDFKRVRDGIVNDIVFTKDSKLKVYYDPDARTTGFLDTSIGCAFLDIEALLKGDMSGFLGSDMVDGLYKTQYTYYDKEVKRWEEYKAKVMGTEEMRAMMDVANDYINEHFK